VLTQVGGLNYATYQDSAGTIPLPNPIPLNSRGEISNSSGVSSQLFLSTGVTYTLTLFDAAGNQLNQAVSVGNYPNQYSVVVTTISALRSVLKTAGATVTVLGYYAAGDIHSRLYYYDAADTTTADNGGTVIVASDGGRWKYVPQDNIVWVKDFGAKTDGTDPASAIQAAITWAAANSHTVGVNNGTYTWSTPAGNLTTLPKDDGTVYPAWVGAGDSNITAETATTMPFALACPNGVVMVGESPGGVTFLGPWLSASSAIATSSGGFMVIGTNVDGGLTGSPATVVLKNIIISQWMIGLMGIGTAFYGCQVDNVGFRSCGINAVIQACDGNAKFTNITSYYSYAGIIFGGWWLMRDRTSYEVAYMPPYPGTDVYRTGWCDNTVIDTIQHSSCPNVSGKITAIDTFFDTYFFKTANSAAYPTGRASINSSPNWQGFGTYRGVCGHAVAYYSRYGRQSQRNAVTNSVGNSTVRSAIYAGKSFALNVTNAYWESCCWATVGSVNFADPYYGTAGTLGTAATGATYSGSDIIAYTAGGVTPVIGQIVTGTGIPANTIVVYPLSTTLCRISALATATNTGLTFTLTGNAMPPAGCVWTESGYGTVVNALMDQSPAGLAAVIGPNLTPATNHAASGPAWYPYLLLGTTLQSAPIVDARYHEVGNGDITFSLSLFNAAYTKSGAGQVIIAGLPIAAASNVTGTITVNYFADTAVTTPIFAYLSGNTIGLYKTVNRGTQLTDADLTNGTLSIQISGTYIQA
jgi:hypothetical protein